MSRIKMQVTLTFTADVDSDLSADDIMERVDLSAVGDGEFAAFFSSNETVVELTLNKSGLSITFGDEVVNFRVGWVITFCG